MIYLDNAATSWPKPESVYRELDEFARKFAGNPGRSGHRFAVESEDRVQGCRDGIARLLNAESPDRVILTLNATDGLNIALKGFLRPGDHAITSSIEHNSINRPLTSMAAAGKIEFDKAAPDPDGTVPAAAVEKLVRKNTRIIALTHASNVLGTVAPLEDYVKLARARGIALLLDASQSIGVVPLDVRGLGVDMVAFPGHKNLFGPMGTGALYVREGIDLNAFREGGTGSKAEQEIHPEEMPFRLEGGTPNAHGYAGLRAGVEFVLKEGLEKIRRHEQDLAVRFARAVADHPRVVVYCAETPGIRLGPVSINVRGVDPAEVGTLMDREFGIACRPGIHCAPGTHRWLGTLPHGTVRFSFGYFNTGEDVDAAVRAVHEVAGRAAP